MSPTKREAKQSYELIQISRVSKRSHHAQIILLLQRNQIKDIENVQIKKKYLENLLIRLTSTIQF